MSDSLTQQTIALAGLAQSACLVQQIARRGQADDAAMAASLASLFKIDAKDAPDVFGGLGGIQLGLRQLLKQLGGPGMDPEQAGYAATLLILERKFMADSAMVDAVRDGVERIALKAEHSPSILDDSVVAELAGLYQQTISTLLPKVMVGGEPGYLRQTRNTDHIRALLLAGIRSAVLWRQSGGNRWKLFFQRRRVLDTAVSLLARA
ncbi:high frequency lysogenization protein HflD [Methylogaea oryzae]|uniref:High frequency lysogenization protein HflD homolog n=1 Tax=Methylogaea oryzae TaxID=1295382 RepID=A0A8D5AKV6_9GAMM|nr:high frequency lysogenization protein HflD [Methylogaea oryzae]BBL69540.1 high frequency lysogenization protein HflD [Methylogaea oryzae]